MKQKILTIKQSDLLIVLTILIYRLTLDYIYVNYVYPNYAYYHFKLDYDVSYTIFSYVLLFIIVPFVPRLLEKKHITDVTVALLILMYYVPYTTLLRLCTHDYKYALFVFAYFMLLIVFDYLFYADNYKIKIIGVKLADSKLFILFIVMSGIIVILISGVFTGFRISFDLSEYYELRAEAREYAMPSVLKYLRNWSIVALYIGLSYALIKKRKGQALYIIISLIFAFSYNGKKSTLFMVFVIVIISLFLKDKHLKLFPAIFTGVSLVAVLEVALKGSESFIAKHFIRRLLFIPPFMGTLYYDFFSTHEFDYLRSSVLRRLGFESPYTNIPRYIGQVYFSNVGIMSMNANTGLCGDAYANFGFWSLLFVPLIIVITFKVIEICGKYVDFKIQIVVAVWLAYAFVSGAYFTLLMTNGVIFMGVLLWALSSGNNDRVLDG